MDTSEVRSKMLNDQLSRHNLLLYEGDFAIIAELHPAQSPTSVIRKLVRTHILQQQVMRRRETETLKEFV